jgi:hypothetical protein
MKCRKDLILKSMLSIMLLTVALVPAAKSQDGVGAAPPPPPAPMGAAPASGAIFDLNTPFQSGAAPQMSPQTNFNGNTITPTAQTTGGAGSAAGLNGLLMACHVMFGSMMTSSPGAVADTLRSAQDIEDEAMSALDRSEPDYIPGANREQWGRLGSRMQSRFQEASGDCQQKFITPDGRLGPWGQYAMTAMNEHRDVYENPLGPRDTQQFCPRFSTFDADQRKQFWAWFFLSLASPESSCRATAINPNAPNGSALGLFQLETPACRRVGLNFSSQDLMNPYKNIECAVALFAREMRERDTIMIGHSRGRGGTYWGPLRNDDHNRARGGDIRGAQHLRGLLDDFEACR